jgi:putative peptidoglycan lipid II flippase
MSILRSSVVVGGLTASSRVLGFVRDAMIAATLGAGPVAEAFFTAFKLPNLFRRILAEGALNSAFVPLYAGKLEAEGQEAADRFGSEVVSFLASVLVGLIILAQLAMPFLMQGLMPGNAGDGEWVKNAALLGLLTMPYIGFMSLMALYGGALNARHRFAAFAAAPVLLNIVLVAIMLGPIGQDWQAAQYVSGGVFIAGLMQFGLVYWGARRSGIEMGLRWPRLTPDVRRVIALGVPGAIAAGAVQINLIISHQMASFVDGAVAWLAYADRLYQLPLGVIGIAMGIVLLPTISRRVRAMDDAGASKTMNRGLEIAAFFALPATTALTVTPDIWVMALFEHGRFGAEDTANTAPLVAAFGVGVPFFIAVKVFAPGFFARHDTKRPMRYALVSVGLNIVVGASLFLLTPLGVSGLALATSLAGAVNAGLLARTLYREKHWSPDAALIGRSWRMVLAALMMAALLFAISPFVRPLLGGLFITDLAIAGTFALAGLTVYAGICLSIGALKPAELKAALRRSA